MRAMDEAGPKKNAIYYLSLIGFFGIFSTTISKNPVLPLFARDMGAGDPLLGVIAALSPLAGILFSFPVGFLSDRLGRKRLLVVSSLFFLVSPLLYLFVTNPVYLIPVRFLHGVATAILGPLASAIIVSAYPQSKGEKIGLYSSVTLAGRAIAPLLGGLIIGSFAYLGHLANYRLVYAAAFLAGIPVLVFALLFKSEPGQSAHVRGIDLSRLAGALKYFASRPALRSASFVEMATYFSFGAFETYFPLFLSGRGVPAGAIGFIFSLQVLSIALTKPFFGRLADRFDKRLQILAGVILTGVSVALIPLASQYPAFVALSLVFGAGMSFSTVATCAFTAEAAEKEHLGASMGALSSLMDVGHSAGPFITGFIITAASLSYGFFFSAFVCFLAAAFFSASVFRSPATATRSGKSK
ncbi:MAG: MFS transporter [Endomicrobiales bacterium]